MILFWTRMEQLHYPGAGETKKYLLEQKEKQEQMQQEQARAMARQAAMQDAAASADTGRTAMNADDAAEIRRQAIEAARADVQSSEAME